MITVQADANKLICSGVLPEEMAVLDSNENGFAYLTDAITAVSLIAVHAEMKYGPLITDALLAAIEGGTLRKKITEKRGETENVQDQMEDCPGC